jgi:hypothetical protein
LFRTNPPTIASAGTRNAAAATARDRHETRSSSGSRTTTKRTWFDGRMRISTPTPAPTNANRCQVGFSIASTSNSDQPANAAANSTSDDSSWKRIPYPGYASRTTATRTAARMLKRRAATNQATIEPAYSSETTGSASAPCATSSRPPMRSGASGVRPST